MALFDHIFLGSGLAAHLKALRLVRKKKGLKLLFLDQKDPTKLSHSWCYWQKSAHIPEHLVERKWNKMTIAFQDIKTNVDIHMCPYQLVMSHSYLKHIQQELKKKGRCCFSFSEPVCQVKGNDVETTKRNYFGRCVWDSRLRLDEFEPNTLMQDFLECKVRVGKPIWDPEKVTLMDFIPFKGGVYFLYLLPLDTQTAFVTPTAFTLTPLTVECHKNLMIKYLTERYSLHCDDITIERSIRAQIPMGFLSHPSTKIGLAGGQVRASTGYTFWHHLRELDMGNFAPNKKWDQWMDRLFLNLIKERPSMMPQLFVRLFQRCPPESLIRFLQGDGSILDRLQVMKALPKTPFLKQVIRW